MLPLRFGAPEPQAYDKIRAVGALEPQMYDKIRAFGVPEPQIYDKIRAFVNKSIDKFGKIA